MIQLAANGEAATIAWLAFLTICACLIAVAYKQ